MVSWRKKYIQQTRHSRVMVVTDSGEPAILHSAMAITYRIRRYLISHIKPINVQEVIQDPHVSALDAIQLQSNHHVILVSLNVTHFGHVVLINRVNEFSVQLVRLLVQLVLLEGQTFVHVKLRQVDYDRGVLDVHEGGIDHPFAPYRGFKLVREIRGLDDPSKGSEGSPTLRSRHGRGG